jgi:hypothetical protein
MEDGHVVVGSQVVHRGFRNLDIGIGIPWQDLLMISPVHLQGGYPTFRFHHQPSSVPCISHVSTPISAKVAR